MPAGAPEGALGRFGMQVTVDAVVRLLACPWVQPLVLRPHSEEVCTVEVSGVARDALTLTATVRDAFAAAPAGSSASASEVNALKRTVETRLAAVERLLGEGGAKRSRSEQV